MPFPTSGDLPDPGIESEFPVSPALADRFFTAEHMGSQTFGRWSLSLFPQGYSASDFDFLCGYNGTDWKEDEHCLREKIMSSSLNILGLKKCEWDS